MKNAFPANKMFDSTILPLYLHEKEKQDREAIADGINMAFVC